MRGSQTRDVARRINRYITLNKEAYHAADLYDTSRNHILSFFPNRRFEADNRQYHNDFTLSEVVRGLRDAYGYDDADTVLDYVITRVERRYDRAKDRLRKCEIGCYLHFLHRAQEMIQDLAKQEAARRSNDGFMAKILRFYRGGQPDIRIVVE